MPYIAVVYLFVVRVFVFLPSNLLLILPQPPPPRAQTKVSGNPKRRFCSGCFQCWNPASSIWTHVLATSAMNAPARSFRLECGARSLHKTATAAVVVQPCVRLTERWYPRDSCGGVSRDGRGVGGVTSFRGLASRKRCDRETFVQ